ncbi:4-hydroxybenzoate 3-monooxygenase [Geomicrobium sp. JCM 19039]|uniref:4-hydroxybenzoate 3-monooxygenase n=1 Tax=Geomicrobium sp. JCM 19039 TaxID=1460636 RepID=UPI00045F4508|nr:4-hydroxybenzoate 3-monooxygenase [Geomicrobium sp. JCM 19039]GAK14256.1 p-hydroxybenzoate hydroxylase [Geomicrobium sp. JCM 19039]
MHTNVVIIGAGPAGLMLSHLLSQNGIDSIILEKRSRKEIEETVRAGVLEQGTVDLLKETGVGTRIEHEGFEHEGIYLQFGQKRERIDFPSLTGGKKVVVYPQHEVLKDLLKARIEDGAAIHFEVDEVKTHAIHSNEPYVTYTPEKGASEETITCDYIAGCDGFHGPCRETVTESDCSEYEKLYDYGWLGVLAETEVASDELVYANHENGFALLSTRTPTLQRFYLQVDRKDDINLWSDDRIWTELKKRSDIGDGKELKDGPIVSKNIVSMRSYVCETMRKGNLFLAGDAAHIVPPTGAKGLNLAISDIQILAEGLKERYHNGSENLLDRYEEIALQRIWKAQRFSSFMTTLLHTDVKKTKFERKIQESEFHYLVSSEAAKRSLAENYTGLPIEWGRALAPQYS